MNTNIPQHLLRDFVAIDIEYADSAQHICQFGLAVVRDLRVVESRTWNIQPPANSYEQQFMQHHHLTAADTLHSPTFEQAWPEIYEYLRGKSLWAHNAASVERHVIDKNLAWCKTDFESIGWINDSRSLYHRPDCPPNKGNGLPQCCLALGIPFDESQHHSAEYDAVKCAEIVIAYTEGRQPDWTGVPVSKEELRKQQKTKVLLHLGEFQDYAARIEAAKAKLKASPAAKAATTSQPDLFAAPSQPDLFAAAAQPDLFTAASPSERPVSSAAISSQAIASPAASSLPGGPCSGKRPFGPSVPAGSNSAEPSPLMPYEDSLLHYTDLFASLSSTRPGAAPQTVDVFDAGDRLPKEGRGEVDYTRLNTAADNPLQGCKVAVTGSFYIGRDAIRQALKAMGAAYTSSISKKTAAVLIGSGNVGLPKLADIEKLAYNGYIIPRIVGNDDLDRFLYDDPTAFGIRQGDTPRKQLDLTWAHLQESTWPLQYPVNNISGKEIYLPASIPGDRQALAQVFGNLGAYANNELDADTQLILLPEATVAALQQGRKDDLISEVEQFYNAIAARTFDLSFLLLSDFYTFVHTRLAECHDAVTAHLLSAYEDSCMTEP